MDPLGLQDQAAENPQSPVFISWKTDSDPEGASHNVEIKLNIQLFPGMNSKKEDVQAALGFAYTAASGLIGPSETKDGSTIRWRMVASISVRGSGEPRKPTHFQMRVDKFMDRSAERGLDPSATADIDMADIKGSLSWRFWHELGHLLGLPEEYNTKRTGAPPDSDKPQQMFITPKDFIGSVMAQRTNEEGKELPNQPMGFQPRHIERILRLWGDAKHADLIKPSVTYAKYATLFPDHKSYDFAARPKYKLNPVQEVAIDRK